MFKRHLTVGRVVVGAAIAVALVLGTTPVRALAVAPAYTSIVFFPAPIANPGSLPAGATVTVTVEPEALGAPVAGVTVNLSIATLYTPGSAAGGTAFVGVTQLTGTPALFTSDAAGKIVITYHAPNSQPLNFHGRDVITATDPANTSDTNTDVYVFSPVSQYVFSPVAPIAAPGSLAPGSAQPITITADDVTGHPVPSAIFFVTLDGNSGPPVGSATITGLVNGQTKVPTSSTCSSQQTTCRVFSDSSAQATLTYTAGSAPGGALDTITVEDHLTHTAAATDSYTYSGAVAVNGFTLDAYGGVYHFGSVGSSSGTGTRIFPFKIARGLSVQPSNMGGGFILDGWGGVHPFGANNNAPITVGPYWQNWDIARAIVFNPCDTTTPNQSGYVLDGFGALHPWATRLAAATPPAVTGTPYFAGFDIARAVVMTGCTSGTPDGYTLDGWGGVHPFGAAAPVTSGGAYFRGWDIARGIVAQPVGGYLLDGWGAVHSFNGATVVNNEAYWPGWDIARGISTFNTTSAPAGYTLDGYGGVHQFGAATGVPAPFYASGQDIFRAIGVTT